MKNHDTRIAKLEERAARQSPLSALELKEIRKERWNFTVGLAQEIISEENGQPTGTSFRERFSMIPADDRLALLGIRNGLIGMSRFTGSKAIRDYGEQISNRSQCSSPTQE